jgi:hypothetical protein
MEGKERQMEKESFEEYQKRIRRAVEGYERRRLKHGHGNEHRSVKRNGYFEKRRERIRH